MIKLIYSVIVADIEALQTQLQNNGITVIGISTVEQWGAPETQIFVEDTITEPQKTVVDSLVGDADQKPPPIATTPVPVTPIVDEPRDLP